MTVTIVFGKTSDGYLYSYDANFTNSRNGPADGVTGGNTIYVGRNNNGGQYAHFIGYVGYDYPAIPSSEVVTAAAVRLWILNQLSSSFQQNILWRGIAWSSGGLTVADWQTPAALLSGRQDGNVALTSSATGAFVQASSDELLSVLPFATTLEHAVHTSYNVNGSAPTRDEGIAIASADQAGTTFDPQMIYTSVARSTLFGVLGAHVEVSDGWAWLESNGAATPTITLKYRPFDSATVTSVGNIPIGTSVNQFAIPAGYQALALVTNYDTGDLFVIGRYSQAENAVAVLAFQRGGGTTWTVKTMRSTNLPTYQASVNQVVAIWHPYGAGSILAMVGHLGSAGDSIVHNETMHVIFDPAPLIANNTGASFVRGSGYSLPALGYTSPPSQYFNAWHNETGNGMDLASPAQHGGSTDQAYFFSFGANQNPGDNKTLYEGWYILNGGSTGFQWTKLQATSTYGRKDAAGKVRVVPISSQAAAFISADSDAGWGLTINVRNHTGTESTSLVSRALADEGITNMPDGPAVAQSSAWDALYNAIENSLWIYYVDSADAGKLRRTSLDLSTMQLTLQSVVVYDNPGAGVIQAVRTQRSGGVGQTTLVSIAVNTAGVLSTVYVVDTFNIAPYDPTLTPRDNFDATQAALFAWTFNDPNNDPQYAYQLEISRVSDGVVVLDTGKVVSATESRNVAGSTIANGVSYRWRVTTWDPSDVQGPWSGYGTFATSAGGTVTITNPPTDNPLNIITDDIPVSWSVSGTTQAAYRVWLYRGATLVSDTDWVASTDTTATVAGMLSDEAHEIRVQVRNGASVVTNIASRFLTPSYSTPEVPTFSATPDVDGGFVLIAIDNPTPGAPSLGFPEEGFESGLGTWSVTNNTALALETGIVHRGTKALRFTSTLSGEDPISTRDYGNQRVVVPGVRYTARMWFYTSIEAEVQTKIDWSAPNGDYISTSSYEQILAPATWTLVEVTAAAPDGAGLAAYGPSIHGAVAAGVYGILDEVTFGVASDRPDVTENQILRRVAGTDDAYEIIGTTGPDGDFRDYTATAGIVYEYRVRGNA